MAFGQIQRLFDEGTLTGLTDAQLLDRFLTRRDEGAFAALVERHGPMVLAVCRGVLKHASDAEDAFQATFLVLFRKAGGLRSAGSLGGWLYRVAYRIALRANAVASRRRLRFSEEGMMAVESAASGGAEVDRELLPIIHAEIDRLPERYRAPIALCYLEGLSYEQAAHQLGWPLGTVGSRIARARELLRSRLTRRGVTATTAALSALLAREATAAPAGWVEAATRAAMTLGAAANGAKAAGAVSAAVALSDQVLRRMLMIRLIQMTSALAVVATAGFLAWASLGPGGEAMRVSAPAAAAQAQTRRADDVSEAEAGNGPIRGRVLSPDGKPVRDAEIFVGQSPTGWLIEPVARTGADGRFEVDRARLPREKRIGVPAHDWKRVEVAAVAPGYGPARTLETTPDGADLVLRLITDDVPIRGRILDTQGRPIAGVGVHLGGSYEPPAGDVDALLRSGTIRQDQLSGDVHTSGWWIKEGDRWSPKTIRTGPDGRFQIEGLGRDRLALIEIDGPGIARARVWAMTRPAPPSSGPRPVPYDPFAYPRIDPLRGAIFDYVVVPSRPIEGLVRARATGRPLAGVEVWGAVPESDAHSSATTGPDGRFRINGLPKSPSYEIRATAGAGQPYLPTSTKVSDTDGLKPIPVTLDPPRGVVIQGRLIDKATGKSVAGHDVIYFKLPSNANEGEGSQSFPFGPDGFRMTVPPGPALFKAQAEGTGLPYTRARLPEAVRRMGIAADDEKGEAAIHFLISGSHVCRMVDVPADVETFSLDLELTRGATRAGRLVDPDGQPVVGTTVYGLTSDSEVKTLEGATFEVVGMEPGEPRTVSFMHKDRRLAGAVVFEPGGGPIEVRLAPCGSAVGRLVDTDGRPLAGALIGISVQDRRGVPIPLNSGLWPSGEFVNADEQGRFRVDWMIPELIAQLSARPRSRPDVFLIPEGTKRAAFEHLEVKPGRTVDLGEIHMKRPPNG
jgi:RNA polymerase sigma factor (sigma-70 family)